MLQGTLLCGPKPTPGTRLRKWWSCSTLTTQTFTRHSLEEVVELFDGAVRPLEALGGVAEVAHDEAVLPAAAARARPLQVGGRRGAVVNRAQPGGGAFR